MISFQNCKAGIKSNYYKKGTVNIIGLSPGLENYYKKKILSLIELSIGLEEKKLKLSENIESTW